MGLALAALTAAIGGYFTAQKLYKATVSVDSIPNNWEQSAAKAYF